MLEYKNIGCFWFQRIGGFLGCLEERSSPGWRWLKYFTSLILLINHTSLSSYSNLVIYSNARLFYTQGQKSPPVHHWIPSTSKIFCCWFSVTKLCPTLCHPMDCSPPGFSVLHYLPEFAQIHVHGVSDAIGGKWGVLFWPSDATLQLSPLGELCDSAVAGSTNLGEEAPPV